MLRFGILSVCPLHRFVSPLIVVGSILILCSSSTWAQEANAVEAAQQQEQDLEDERELIRLFADTLEQVKSRYVEADVSDRELIEAAIKGMISRLDPYSNYIPPEDLAPFLKGVEREFVGIGIQVQISENDGNLQITSPLYGTPAWRAGLRAGDTILKIDDTSTRGLSLDEAVKLMSGKVGTKVSITVLHPDSKKAETVRLVRERIQQATVIGYARNAQGEWDFYCEPQEKIAYVRVTAFTGTTALDLRRTLNQLLEQQMEGLILDMRFNPGGMLNQAVEVCDMFLSEGRIVSIEGRSTPAQSWDAEAEGTLIPKGFPIAVLVNRFSASAAEIVAACLQDNGAATIVGERSWGKGSVQNIIVLENGNSALKLTTAGYHRPSGKNIHREVGATEDDLWGVSPDEGYVVRTNNREMYELRLLFNARDALTKVRRANGKPIDRESDANDEETAKGGSRVDRQLEKAMEAVREQMLARKNSSHQSPAKSEAEQPAESPETTVEPDAQPTTEKVSVIAPGRSS